MGSDSFLDGSRNRQQNSRRPLRPLAVSGRLRSRSLDGSIERLESRQMLTSMFCELDIHPAEAAIASFAAAEPHLPEATPASIASFASATDAGDSLTSARDLGSIRGRQSFRGSVGGYDARDVVQFRVDRPGQFVGQLDQLSADVDFYLLDARGRTLSRSIRPGSAAERIAVDLAPGSYYLVVSPYHWRGSSYQLTLDFAAQPALTPRPLPAPNPISRPTPTPAPTQPSVPEPAPPVPSVPGHVAPAPSIPSPEPSPMLVFPDVPYFGGPNDWNLNAVNAPEAWAQGFTGQGITVAVVDTGVDLDHPDLVHQLWVNPGEIPGNGRDDDGNGFIDDVHGWDFVSNDSVPDDLNGHGTHVAGTIAAARDGRGATGVAPGATILPVRVLDASGTGELSDVAAGIRYAVNAGAEIINLSLGGGVTGAVQAAIDHALRAGVLIVAAAGNESASVPAWPARFSATHDNVISVGANTSDRGLASFSNRVGGSQVVQVDAPGSEIFSTMVGGGYARLNGTSMAAPHVAGLAALTLSAQPNLSVQQLRTLIVNGADQRIRGSDSIGGINAARTVALAAAGQGAASGAYSATTMPSGSDDTTRARTTSRYARNVDLVFAQLALPFSQSSSTDDRTRRRVTRGAFRMGWPGVDTEPSRASLEWKANIASVMDDWESHD